MVKHERMVIIDNEAYPYILRRSRRARRIALHVDVRDGIELVVPWHVAFTEAEKFLLTQKEWMINRTKSNQRLLQSMPRRKFETGTLLPLFDEEVPLHVSCDPARARTHVKRSAAGIHASVARQEQVREVVERWYKKEAKIYFTAKTAELSALLGVRVKKVSIGSHRSQWGSCSQAGRLSFAWRLLLGPEWVAKYVAAHEVAHLVHANHSKQYWALVRGIYPQADEARAWLRQRGHELYL